jgi:hypothetical protein
MKRTTTVEPSSQSEQSQKFFHQTTLEKIMKNDHANMTPAT